MNFEDALKSVPVIPVIVLQRSEDGVPIAEALIEGGIPIFEFTLRTEAALPAIAEIAKRFPEAQTGAGTVLNKAQARQALDAGAQYIVSPGWDGGVVKTAQKSASCPPAASAPATWPNTWRCPTWRPSAAAGWCPRRRWPKADSKKSRAWPMKRGRSRRTSASDH